MSSLGRVGFDESAIALVVQKRVFRCREYGVAFGGDGGSDVIVRRTDGVGHYGWREGTAEDEVDYSAAVFVKSLATQSRVRDFEKGYLSAHVVPGTG